MRKSIIALILTAALTAALFTGCGFGSAPTLPSVDLYSSTLSGTVQYISGQDCRVVISDGDSHYDDGDVIQVSFSSVAESKPVEAGDRVTFEYDYIKNVTEYNDLPHITVDEITVE